MVGVPPARDDEENRLTGARGEFVASLPRRLEQLRAGLAALAEVPADRERLNGLLRRLHALASAARVLGFASVAEVLAEAERTLRRSGRTGPQSVVLKEVARAFEMLPSLVAGAPPAPRAAGPEGDEAGRSSPVSILVFGPVSLADAFRAEVGERFELEHTEDAARAAELARSNGPDAVILDADAGGTRELVELLRSDPLIEPVPLVVVGGFANADAATVFVAAGADRVLTKPVSPETLRRTLLELGELASRPRAPREPVGELTVEELAERIAGEVKKGLIDSLELGGQATRVNFGDGADVLGAVWGAVARVRELVTLRSSGNLRFQPLGPEGAIPLAPWMNDERRAGERGVRHGRAVDDVALKGRRIVVADDDPAVVWFLSGLLKAVGAQVIEAHDGERALELVFESWPDLVVSDVLMPRRDGFSLCHEIKRDVVVRDVPVILLSWKEDLLQRVRELGAAADGYLRKEAAASTVVERVREVLRPRARIEQRLRVGGEVRGRLDGVTPRLVLELVSQSCPDATLTIRDAVYLYEAHLRAGRLRSLTRSAADGSFERGPSVLAALLGVSAGRFVVQPDSTPCRAEFDASLPELFDGPVRRARSALAALAAERLPRVVRVDVELGSFGGYLDCTPENARRLIERLAAGESPRDLLLSGEASAWLLEAVLSDLARRGAISGVEREAGASVVPSPDPLARTVTYAADFAPADTAWSESAKAHETSAPANTRVSAAAVSDAEAQVAPAVAAPMLTHLSVGAPTQSESVVLEREQPDPAAQAGPAASAGDDGWFSFQIEATTGASREVPAVAPVPSSEEADSVFAALAEETADEPAAPLRAPAAASRRDLTPAGLGPSLAGAGPLSGAVEPRSETPQRVGVRPVLRMPPPSSERGSPSMADVFAAALADAPDPNAEITVRAVVQPPSKTDPAPADSQAADAAAQRSPSEPSAPARPADSGTLPAVHEVPRPGPSAAPGAGKVEARRSGESGSTLAAVREAPRPGESGSTLAAVREAPRPAKSAESEPESSSPALSAVRETTQVDLSLPGQASAEPPRAELAATLPAEGADQAALAASLTRETVKRVAVALAIEPVAPKPALGDTVRSALADEPAPSATGLASPDTERSAEPPSVSEESSDPLLGSASAPAAEASGSASRSAVATPPPPPSSRRLAAAEPTPAPPPVAAKPSAAGELARTIPWVVVAFGGTFAAFTWVVLPALAPVEPIEATPAPSAIVAAARGSSTPPASGPKMSVQLFDLPAGFDPGPGRGLVEIATAPGDSLYVDGTFVGRGPGRSVPLAAGRHEVKIVRADAEHTTFVELTAGRRTRVSLELEASAPPRP